MLNTAAITVAIISLVAAVLTAGVTSWFTYSTDARKAMREREGTLQKYRDPLLFAALDLQERLFDILDGEMRTLINGRTANDGEGGVYQDWIYIYTAFVFGQYFAWVHILRRKAQFIAFVSKGRGNRRTKDLTCILDAIERLLNREYKHHGELPFMLWKDHQMAIGEIMTIRDCGPDRELICKSLAEFSREWKKEEADISGLGNAGDKKAPNRDQDNNDQSSIDYTKPPPANATEYPLHNWLWSIPYSIKKFYALSPDKKGCGRIRKFQHDLIDLIEVLDPDRLRTDKCKVQRCSRANGCRCRECKRDGSYERDKLQAGKPKETV